MFAVVISISRLLLLAGVYFGSARVDDSFVSTSLDNLLAFKIVLTQLVILETLFCGAYLTFLQQVAPGSLHVALVILCVSTVLGGWTTLASNRLTESAHMTGTLIFLAGSAGLQSMLVKRSVNHRQVFVALWVAIFGCGAAFVATSITSATPECALVEWIGFMLEAASLALYFYENPIPVRIRQEVVHTGIESAKPLLDYWGDTLDSN